MSTHLAALLLAMALDRMFGEPEFLWRRVSHPVVLIGAAIDALDRTLNRPCWSPARRRAGGIFALTLLVLGALLIGGAIVALLSPLGPLAWMAEGAIASVFIAHGSLVQHVGRVADALREEGLEGGRRAVSRIVGRDVTVLDEAGVCRAALESLGENASDGIIAPLFWYAVLGLPGLLAYKAINTADSMIGHLSERHRVFGWAAARLDDLVNWPAARLTALLLAIGAAFDRPGELWRILKVTRTDAPSHRSPNAGWPETALAAGLGVALGGPRRYASHVVEAQRLNPAGRFEVRLADLERGIALLDRTLLGLAGLILLLLLAALIA